MTASRMNTEPKVSNSSTVGSEGGPERSQEDVLKANVVRTIEQFEGLMVKLLQWRHSLDHTLTCDEDVLNAYNTLRHMRRIEYDLEDVLCDLRGEHKDCGLDDLVNLMSEQIESMRQLEIEVYDCLRRASAGRRACAPLFHTL